MWLFFLLSLFLASDVLAFPDTSVLDNFNRTDENPVAGIWTNGVTGTGTCQVLSNRLQDSASGTEDCYVTQTYSTPQELFYTLPTATSLSDNVNLRAFMCLQGGLGASTADGYVLRYRSQTAANDDMGVERMDNAAFTGLGSFLTDVAAIADGDSIGMSLAANGDMQMYTKISGTWAALSTARNDATYTCANTNLGIMLQHSSHAIDDFGGGQVVTDTPGPYMILRFN